MKAMTILLIGIMLVAASSCKKVLDVGEPGTQLSSTAIFASDATATGALLGIYSQMESQGIFYRLVHNTGLSADEFVLRITDPNYVGLATNNLAANNTLTHSHWIVYYSMIYQLNAVLEGLEHSSDITEGVKNQLRGEALMTRSMFYFYLVNLFGDVPIVTTTDYNVNSSIARIPAADVYAFIVADLVEAESLLSDQYKNPSNANTTERVRPNKATAQALLARTYLYMRDWANAANKASQVIGNALYSMPTNLDQVFLKNSSEQIWQIMAVVPNFNSFTGNQLILAGEPFISHFDSSIVKQFRPGDKRRIHWVASIDAAGTRWYYPYKHKVKNSGTISEYTSAMRLSEQYLIRAEARTMLDDMAGACADLSVVRVRAGLGAVTGLNQEQLLDSLQVERRFELFAESGDRWLNLKRTGRATAVLSVIKGSSWNETDVLYPIPFNERLLNPALTQNPGY